MTKYRGFNKLDGVTIGYVDTTAVNEVALFTSDDKSYFLIKVEVIQGIPILSCKKYKNIENSNSKY